MLLKLQEPKTKKGVDLQDQSKRPLLTQVYSSNAARRRRISARLLDSSVTLLLRDFPAIVGYPHEWESSAALELGTSQPDREGKINWPTDVFSHLTTTVISKHYVFITYSINNHASVVSSAQRSCDNASSVKHGKGIHKFIVCSSFIQ